jgi:hypothetical protein
MQAFTLPAVPRGSSSMKYVSRTPSRSPLPKWSIIFWGL